MAEVRDSQVSVPPSRDYCIRMYTVDYTVALCLFLRPATCSRTRLIWGRECSGDCRLTILVLTVAQE